MRRLTKLDKLFEYGYRWKNVETCYSVYIDRTLTPTLYMPEWTYTKKQTRFWTSWREEEKNFVNKTNLTHNLFLVYLSIPTFRATMGSSSGETAVLLRHLVLVIVCGWLSGMQGEMNFDSTLHTRQSSIQNNKYQVSQKHSCFSWWWINSRPKHVEIDKY